MTHAQAAHRPITEARINTFLAQVYLVMALGLAITGFVASWTSNNIKLLLRINTMPGFAFGIFIVQIIIVVALSAAVMRMSPAVAFLLFLFYSGLTGLTFASLFVIYTESEIAQVFWLRDEIQSLRTSAIGPFTVTSGAVLHKDSFSAFDRFL